MISKSNILKSWLVLLSFVINHSVHGSYQYAGCFTQVFYDSLFTSSYMEPALCFRLCDTPIIYLQKTICRCAGGGLMHHGREEDKFCNIPCAKPVNGGGETSNTCGGHRTYSAYAENEFYIRHGNLFTYQINFLACELWSMLSVYQTNTIDLNSLSIKSSSLNKMERCAAGCLDQNSTTKSIGILKSINPRKISFSSS